MLEKKMSFDQVKQLRENFVSMNYEKQREYLGSLIVSKCILDFRVCVKGLKGIFKTCNKRLSEIRKKVNSGIRSYAHAKKGSRVENSTMDLLRKEINDLIESNDQMPTQNGHVNIVLLVHL